MSLLPRRGPWLGVVLALLGCQSATARPAEPVVVEPGSPAPATVEAPVEEAEQPHALALSVQEVNDVSDPFAPPDAQADPEKGVALEVETTRAGDRTYAEATVTPSESEADAKARLLAYVRGISIPAGHWVGVQRSVSGETVRWRTYLLKDERLLSDANLRSAELRRDELRPEGYVLHLEFNEEGARQLAEITERCLQKRIAFVLDGEVVVAPVVMERIEGGRAQVWLADVSEAEFPARFASGVRIERH